MLLAAALQLAFQAAMSGALLCPWHFTRAHPRDPAAAPVLLLLLRLQAKPAVQVSAALVKQLRDKSGAGMMDCKKALGETGGDVEAAVEWLRKKGLSSADKKAGRCGAVTSLHIVLQCVTLCACVWWCAVAAALLAHLSWCTGCVRLLSKRVLVVCGHDDIFTAFR